MMSVSVANIPKNRCRTTTAEPIEANACGTALYRESRRLFRPRPGRPKQTCNSRMARQILCAEGVIAGPHEHAVLFAEGDVFALDHIPFLLLGDALLRRRNVNGNIE